MAKRIKQYSEAELIDLFQLQRRSSHQCSALMQSWLDAKTTLNTGEQYLFDLIFADACENIDGWHEEDLKMKFICFVLRLGNLVDNERFHAYFERTIESTIEGHFLKVKTDFMLAKGILDMPQIPYFHFQEYKRQTDPNGNPVAQVLEAMLIAQTLNANNQPIYGAYVIGKFWNFIVLENKTYSLSKTFDCTEHDDLLKIIAVLRKFNQLIMSNN
jgi:hypothetical protein